MDFDRNNIFYCDFVFSSPEQSGRVYPTLGGRSGNAPSDSTGNAFETSRYFHPSGKILNQIMEIMEIIVSPFFRLGVYQLAQPIWISSGSTPRRRLCP